jgi:hypothetical protein
MKGVSCLDLRYVGDGECAQCVLGDESADHEDHRTWGWDSEGTQASGLPDGMGPWGPP